MKALKTFSIPEINIGKIKGDTIKNGEIPKDILLKLQNNGHVSKPVKKAKK